MSRYKNRWLVLLLSLIFLALLVTPTATAEDINHTSGSFSLAANMYWGYHLALPDGGGIKYKIEANNPVNVYLLDKDNMIKYKNGQDFQYISEGSSLNTQYADVQVYIPSSEGGDYYLIVESANSKPVNFKYDITYGKDVSVSFIDFIKGIIAGFGTSTCIIGGIAFVIWIFVLAWVYKDARRRGKSGALWVLIVLFLSIIGLIIWLIVRPKVQTG